MKRAIELGTAGSPLTVADIEDIHRTLLRITEDTEIAGVVRTTQNWIGGNDYNPVGASYVPPRPEHVPLLEYLWAFVNRVYLAPSSRPGLHTPGRQQKPSDSPTRSSSSDQPGSTISAGHVAMPRFGSS